MIGIIYENLFDAENDLEKCDILNDGKPYTYIVKRPNQNQWAIISDEKIEDILGKKGKLITQWSDL